MDSTNWYALPLATMFHNNNQHDDWYAHFDWLWGSVRGHLLYWTRYLRTHRWHAVLNIFPAKEWPIFQWKHSREKKKLAQTASLERPLFMHLSASPALAQARRSFWFGQESMGIHLFGEANTIGTRLNGLWLQQHTFYVILWLKRIWCRRHTITATYTWFTFSEELLPGWLACWHDQTRHVPIYKHARVYCSEQIECAKLCKVEPHIPSFDETLWMNY